MSNILVGCEESGTVRDAFIRAGHTAWSCDLLPSRGENIKNHEQRDILGLLDNSGTNYWDLIILFPDCTKMCVAGNRHYAETEAREEAIEWTLTVAALAKRKARIGSVFENPASVIWPRARQIGWQVQYIQPWQFGHMEQKKTGLGLDRLPPLAETNNVYDAMMQLSIKERERVFYMSPGPDRARDRSVTFSGIAQAMVDQWGVLK